jgi:hypothetical protein
MFIFSDFREHYCVSASDSLTIDSSIGCSQQNSVLFLFLMLATVWLAVILYDFNKT